MTHGKANNHSHRIPQQFGALLQQRPVVEGSAYDNFATAGKKIQPPGAKPQPLVNLQKTRSTSLTVSKQPLREDTSPRYARSLQAQSTVLRGGVASCPNQTPVVGCRPVVAAEQMFEKSWQPTRRTILEQLFARSGRRSRRSILRSAQAFRSAARSISSTASASRTLTPCTFSAASFSAADTTSGDGLGIQQPGSMTWGTKAKVQTPSGRADDSAICPAVARNDRRAA